MRTTEDEKQVLYEWAEKWGVRKESVNKACEIEATKKGVAKDYTAFEYWKKQKEKVEKGDLEAKRLFSCYIANTTSQRESSKKKRSKSLNETLTRNATIGGKIAKSADLGLRVVPEVEKYLRDKFQEVDENGQTYLQRYLDRFLENAEKFTSGKESLLLASSIFNENLMRELDASIERKMEADREFLRYRIRSTLYDKQQEVFDNNIDQTIECICTRRAGKTVLVSRLAVLYALAWNESPVLYLNRNFDNAATQCGPSVEKVLKELCIHYTGTPQGGRIQFDNGSSITFSGFNNKGDIDRFRGGKYRLVIVDEIGHLRNPKVLIEEVLEPAQIDYGKEAKMIFIGTPPRNKKSYAYSLWHNSSIKHYRWSFLDNPFIPDKEDVIEKVCKKHGVTIDSPLIQREYFGNMEAFDTDSMIFKGYKTYEKLPAGAVTHAWVGVDWGFEDNAAVTSFVVINGSMYEMATFLKNKQSISDIANEVKRQYDDLIKLKPAHSTWVICDTNEKSATYELYSTYKIPNVGNAYKYDKSFAIDQLAEWMRTDRIFLKKDGLLAEEADNTLFKRDEEDNIVHEIDDELFHPNGLFALLYISRQYAFDVLGLTEYNKGVKRIDI